jgi:hypothetical protein
MKLSDPRQRRWFFAFTVLLWLLLCTGYDGFRIASLLRHPGGDLYANTWSFQLMVFAVFRLPIWVFALLVVLLGELAISRRSRGSRS